MLVFDSPFKEVNYDRLKEEARLVWGDSFKDVNEHVTEDARYLRTYFYDSAIVSQEAINKLITQHDPNQLSEKQYTLALIDSLQNYMSTVTVTNENSVDVLQNLIDLLRLKGII